MQKCRNMKRLILYFVSLSLQLYLVPTVMVLRCTVHCRLSYMRPWCYWKVVVKILAWKAMTWPAAAAGRLHWSSSKQSRTRSHLVDPSTSTCQLPVAIIAVDRSVIVTLTDKVE